MSLALHLSASTGGRFPETEAELLRLMLDVSLIERRAPKSAFLRHIAARLREQLLNP